MTPRVMRITQNCIPNTVCEYTPQAVSISRLVSSYQLKAHFLYSITIYMLYYNPQHNLMFL